MKNEVASFKRLGGAVFLLSLSIVAYQISLFQILSFTQWHHFAYMVIAVVLLGFGSAGSVLAFFREKVIRHFPVFFVRCLLYTALSMALVIPLYSLKLFSFESHLIFTEGTEAWRFVYCCLLFFMPFFLSAMALTAVFIRYPQGIHRFYAVNMVGCGFGGIVAIAWSSLLFAWDQVFLVALFPFLAACLVIPRSKRLKLSLVSILVFLVIVKVWYCAPQLPVSEYKGISRILLMPDTKVINSENSAYGLVQEVSGPALRASLSLSLNYQGTVPNASLAFCNGEATGCFFDRGESEFLLFTPEEVAYRMSKRNNILLLNEGGGTAISHALLHKTEKITTLVANPQLAKLIRREFSDGTLEIINTGSRSYLATAPAKFDLIKLPTPNSFGGDAGLHALQSQHLLTVEGVSECLTLLKNNGVLMVSCWRDYPVRAPLKLFATLRRALVQNGSNESSIVIIRNWNSLLFLLKREAFRTTELDKIDSFCRENAFKIIMPSSGKSEKAGEFEKLLANLRESDGAEFYRNYLFRIEPPVDDKPYFSQFLKVSNFVELKQQVSEAALPFFELGYFISFFTLAVVSTASLILIIVPLLWLRSKDEQAKEQATGVKLRFFLYFAAIGLGYMFVEMGLIQQFVFYLENPVYSSGVIISTMLFFSGVGSLVSEKIRSGSSFVKCLALLLVILILLLGTSAVVLQKTVSLALILRILITAVIVGIPAFLMGMPLPTALSAVARKQKHMVPWCLGVNSCFSVISTALATIITVELGFSVVMIIAAGAYFVALIAAKKWVY